MDPGTKLTASNTNKGSKSSTNVKGIEFIIS